MNDVGVIGVHAGIFLFLIFRAVALIVLVEDVMVVDQRIGRAREKVEKKLFDLRVVDPLHFLGIVEVGAFGFEMGERDAKPVHAFGTGGRKARIIFADAPRIAHHLREEKIALEIVLLALAQQTDDIGMCRIFPDGVRRNDGIGRPLKNRIRKRQYQPAFVRRHALLADILHALIVTTEGRTPFRLDRSGRSILNHVENALAFAIGDFGERVLYGLCGSRVAVAVEGHIGKAAMRRDGRRLTFRALQRRNISGRTFLLTHGAPRGSRPFSVAYRD